MRAKNEINRDEYEIEIQTITTIRKKGLTKLEAKAILQELSLADATIVDVQPEVKKLLSKTRSKDDPDYERAVARAFPKKEVL